MAMWAKKAGLSSAFNQLVGSTPAAQPAPSAEEVAKIAKAAEIVQQQKQIDKTRALVGGFASPEIQAQMIAARSPQTQQLIRQAMGQAQGLSGRENSALRANALAQVRNQQSAALRDVRGQMGAQGVRGGLASAINAQQQARGVEAVSGAERNLVADNIKYKQEGLKTAAAFNTNQENIERDVMRTGLEAYLTARAQDMGLQGAQMQANASRGGGGKK